MIEEGPAERTRRPSTSLWALLLLGSFAWIAGCVPSGSSGRGGSVAVRYPASDAGLTTPNDAEVTPPPMDAGTIVRDAAVIPDAGVSTPDAGDMCAEAPNKSSIRANIFYGTDLPTHVPLNTNQIMAIGTTGGCSGTLIKPTWVLTAKHCGLNNRDEFCIGAQPGNPNLCFGAARVVNNPSGDMTLMELDRDARTLAPNVEPISIITESLSSAWVGRMAEAAGYGQQETGSSGRREFTAEPIVSVGRSMITIDGQGQRGVCFGDSGGPLMVIASDGSVRVAGDLSGGDSSCVGQDNFQRVDTEIAWIESYTGPTVVAGPQPCGTVSTEGSCSADRRQATYCGPSGTLVTDTCPGNQACAFSPAANGWRCLDAQSDPCGGVTYQGRCASNVLEWCDRGQLLRRECGLCGEACIPVNDTVGFSCVPSANCGDVDFLGRCEGNVAVWCNREARLERRDCGANGQSCAFIDADTGFYCR